MYVYSNSDESSDMNVNQLMVVYSNLRERGEMRISWKGLKKVSSLKVSTAMVKLRRFHDIRASLTARLTHYVLQPVDDRPQL